MNTIRWEPFRKTAGLRKALDRANYVVVQVSIPGFDPEELDISIEEDIIKIKCEPDKVLGAKGVVCREQPRSIFVKSISLPVPVESDRAEATYEDGILTLTMPKAQKLVPGQIKIIAKALTMGSKE
ncbi:Hsp20/alpha crystallin family protein [Chloroflexota bacterium]